MTGKVQITVFPPLSPEAQDKLKAQSQETTRMLVKAITAEHGLSEADPALVLARVEHEALWGPSPLEDVLQRLLARKSVPE